MADALKKVPVREQDAKVRATNFDEVCLGYNKEEAVEEAKRCLGCKKAKCVEGCPVNIDIPGFVALSGNQQILRPACHLWPRLSPGEPVRGKMYPGH